MAVVWAAQAIRDVSRIVYYIAAENPIAARRIARELMLAGESLTIFPRRGRPGRESARELVTVRPYVIVYDIRSDGTVDILRVWHAAQDR